MKKIMIGVCSFILGFVIFIPNGEAFLDTDKILIEYNDQNYADEDFVIQEWANEVDYLKGIAYKGCITRGDFLEYYYRTVNYNQYPQNYKYESVFSDVVFDNPIEKAQFFRGQEKSYPYIMYYYNIGSINGYSDGTFRESQCIKDVEAYSVNFSGNYKHLNETPSEPWYKEYYQAAARRGMEKEYDLVNFRPSDLSYEKLIRILYKVEPSDKSDYIPSLGLIHEKDYRHTIDSQFLETLESIVDHRLNEEYSHIVVQNIDIIEIEQVYGISNYLLKKYKVDFELVYPQGNLFDYSVEMYNMDHLNRGNDFDNPYGEIKVEVRGV